MAGNDWSYIVEYQKGQAIGMVEHGELEFSDTVVGDGFYILYTWGDGPVLLEQIDIRGH